MDKKYTYSLPSAEEWSFAADSKYLPDIDEYAWHYDNSRLQTHTVGVRRPNKWGLYDMLGNVFEFVAPSPPLQGEKKSQAMNARGGAWLNTLDMIGPRENWQIDIYHSCFDLGARVIRRPR